MLSIALKENDLACPVNYVFCRYAIEIDDEVLDAYAEFALISENQRREHLRGQEKEGVQPQTLCTDPARIEVDGMRAHSFEIGFKPGVRIR